MSDMSSVGGVGGIGGIGELSGISGLSPGTDMTIGEVAERAAAVLDEVDRAIVGKREITQLVLEGFLANGHVLLEDFPGLAKTLMARSFAQVMGLQFSRAQFTPDLMPADITGSSIFDQRSASFSFQAGPVFT
ncbi:MAG TPA: AAA family ATPase, partial [Acidimicrobiales bacterium]|nr:AAA family ATPase [Acidimicrobiales bacterium]